MALDSASSLVEALNANPFLNAAQMQEVSGRLQRRFPEARSLVKELVQRRWLTPYQANQFVLGRSAQLVVGSYLLLERIGEGSMGQVFKARQLRLNRIVALKLIRAEWLAHPSAVKRFQREILAASQLSHPNIVTAYDAGCTGQTHFFAMELVEGMDLGRYLQKYGKLPVDRACDYMRQAACGLAHAHERKMVHRDIKPANLLVNSKPGPDGSKHGTVKILDMGLARIGRLSDAEPVNEALTEEGTVIGTLDYIAPEQGRNSHNVDIRADLYSLGCTFYHLLTGQVPFPGESATQKLVSHLMDQARPVEQLRPDVPSSVVRVVRKLMAKRPEDRFATPQHLLKALGEVGRRGAGNTAVRSENAHDSSRRLASQTGIIRGARPTGVKDNGFDVELVYPEAVQPKRRRLRSVLMLTSFLLLASVLAIAFWWKK
jgi:serine/threonine protein kinase